MEALLFAEPTGGTGAEHSDLQECTLRGRSGRGCWITRIGGIRRGAPLGRSWATLAAGERTFGHGQHHERLRGRPAVELLVLHLDQRALHLVPLPVRPVR